MMAKEYIGFSQIAEQVQRKSLKRGFEFNLMVVGESGLGKSTLVNSLLLTNIYADQVNRSPVPSSMIHKIEGDDSISSHPNTVIKHPIHVEKSKHIEKRHVEIEEKGVRLRLTIVDCPGFGDEMVSSKIQSTTAALLDSLDGKDFGEKECLKYIDEQYKIYFDEERGLNRKRIVDNRIHCCLYFIPPYGNSRRGLRPRDVVMLQRLHHLVNVVPVIAKADCLTKKELSQLKASVRSDLEEHGIEIYQFPECDSDDDDDYREQDQILRQTIPFAVIGATHLYYQQENKKSIRGREYPWGFVDIDRPECSDFEILRRFLVQTHLHDLKDVTHDVHYENYRIQRLSNYSTVAARLNLQLPSIEENGEAATLNEQSEKIIKDEAATRSTKSASTKEVNESTTRRSCSNTHNDYGYASSESNYLAEEEEEEEEEEDTYDEIDDVAAAKAMNEAKNNYLIAHNNLHQQMQPRKENQKGNKDLVDLRRVSTDDLLAAKDKEIEMMNRKLEDMKAQLRMRSNSSSNLLCSENAINDQQKGLVVTFDTANSDRINQYNNSGNTTCSTFHNSARKTFQNQLPSFLKIKQKR